MGDKQHKLGPHEAEGVLASTDVDIRVPRELCPIHSGRQSIPGRVAGGGGASDEADQHGGNGKNNDDEEDEALIEERDRPGSRLRHRDLDRGAVSDPSSKIRYAA